jgi:DNA-binding NtrC family response regulator
MKRSILIVDDEPGLRKGLGKILMLQEFTVHEAADIRQAREILHSCEVDLVLLDLKLDGESGLDFLKELGQEEPLLPVIMITAYGNIENAVECLKAGAINYILKPIDKDLLLSVVEKEIDSASLRMENLGLRQTLAKLTRSETINSKSPKIKQVERVVERIKDSQATVLILGESGTGKEVTARMIHFSGNYRDRSFIGINCAALNDNLLESELFGHEKGAFTGAVARKLGRFELAGSGTLFLDEVGDMSLAMQSKLLRVLQERSYERVGGTKSIRSNCRIIAASNKDLSRMLEEGTFREDLYYRLSLVVIRIPALRERKEDLEALIDLFIRQANREYNRNVKGVSEELLSRLKSFDWPGNIRQLKNVISNAVILSSSESIEEIDLFPARWKRPVVEADAGQGLRSVVARHTEQLERELIQRTVDDCSRNLAETARRLKITRKTLYEKIKKYGI